MSVSDDAIITDAASPAALSGPIELNISASIAVDAAPETGRINKNGASPSGIPMCVRNPAAAFAIPHDVNIDTAQNNTHNVGNNPTADVKPFFAPLKNESKSGFFETRINPPHKAITAGIIDETIASGFKLATSPSNFNFSCNYT